MKDTSFSNKTNPDTAESRELSTAEIQKGAVEILRVFKKICETEGFEFCLYFGTLIGAVRHSGFIPWDDDIDVVMPRDSYEKFLAYCRKNKEKLAPFALFHYSTKKNVYYPIARFSDLRYVVREENLKDSGMGLFIDIYPFDECANTIEDVKRIAKKIHTLKYLCISGSKCHFLPGKPGRRPLFIRRTVFHAAQLVGSGFFAFLLDKRAKHRNGRGYAYVGCSAWQIDAPSYARKEWMIPTQMSFEGELYPVPSGYDMILRGIYGDYMQLPPVEKRIGHHFYKAYKK